MDWEIEKLLEQFPERRKDEVEEFFDSLDEPDREEYIDRLVFYLSGGDILKGKEILERVTMREALEWVLLMENVELRM